MEKAQQALITERQLQPHENKYFEQWVKNIDEHILTGQDAHFYLQNEAAFKEFIALIGHDATIDSSKVLGYYYESQSSEVFDERGEAWDFWHDEAPIWSYLERIGDFGIMNEFPNDHKASIAIALDSETAIIYKTEMSTTVVVCEACATTDNPELLEEFALNQDIFGNPKYSCEHATDEVTTDYSVAMVRLTSQDEINKALYYL